MLIKSTQKYIRTSPRKLRLIANSLKGMSPQIALAKLKFAEKAAAELIAKVVKTGIANAKNNFKLDENKLLVKSIEINPGPTLKRGNPVSRGQYHQIKKRTSHISVTLESPDKLDSKSGRI